MPKIKLLPYQEGIFREVYHGEVFKNPLNNRVIVLKIRRRGWTHYNEMKEKFQELIECQK